MDNNITMATVNKSNQQFPEKEISVLLSQQEKQIMESILSIQDFYQLKDHLKLIQIIVNRKQSQRLFGHKKVMMADMFDKQKQVVDEDTKVNVFAQKYSYKDLVQKFKKPKSFRNNLLIRILAKKMEKKTIDSHHTRKNIWLLASGALFSMKNNRGLYEGLVDHEDYPIYYNKSIFHDLHRTVKDKESKEEEMTSLKNILTAFSRRNPYIGYCQGLNFVAFFLMTMQFTEEESFWILSQITETVIPMDYYTNMVGVACDQQIFLEILSIIKPKITKKFMDAGLDGTIISIRWFVCLFTSSLPFPLVKVVWDRLLVQGTSALIKAGLIILSHLEKQILQATEFYQIITIVEEGSKKLQMSDQDFNKQFDKIYICTQGLKIARDLFREFHIKQKLEDRMNSAKKKIQKAGCNPEWPLCAQALNQIRKTGQEFQIWTYRQQISPKIIHDYLDNKKDKPSTSSKSTIVGTSTSEEKILLAKAATVKNNSFSEYVIGRMEHICHEDYNQVRQEEKFKKNKQSNKFLSMIIEGEDEDEDEIKRIENFRKIMRQSSVNLGEEKKLEKCDSEDQISNRDVRKSMEDHTRFQRSQTLQFYTKFVQNNKQLAHMLISKKSKIFSHDLEKEGFHESSEEKLDAEE